jgi:predicted Ser/Thr protein kinase
MTEAVAFDIPKLALRIKEISKTYKQKPNNNKPANNWTEETPFYTSMKSVIRGIILNNQASDASYWSKAGIRMVSPEEFNACLQKVRGNTKVLGQGYYGKVFDVPTDACFTKVPKAVKRVAVKVENLKSDYDSNQTADRVSEATHIAKKAAALGIGPKMYDSFVTVNKDGVVQIIKIFEIVDGSSWQNATWTPAKKQQALKSLEDAIQLMNKNGIIHHDLHTGNVMVTDEGKVYIIDYDLAKMAAKEEQNRIAAFNQTKSQWEPKGAASNKGVRYIYDKLVEDGSIVLANKKAVTRRSSKGRKN